MPINRRRAPSSKISSEKKISGHKKERNYADLIGSHTISGTGKSDVIDNYGLKHSIKSGKKWQIFLYRYERITSSRHLKLLKPCLDAFTENSKNYFIDRTKCIEFKEKYIKVNGRNKASLLSNEMLKTQLGKNLYIESKENLAFATLAVFNSLKNKDNLRNFLNEAIFNMEEVDFLVIEDSTYKKDNLFKVFSRGDVLDIFTNEFYPARSRAGLVPEDYNVAAQKTLLQYKKDNGTFKNIVEIEIRNDSEHHYREVRFNMYSRDALLLLLNNSKNILFKDICHGVRVYGSAIDILKFK